MLEFYAQRLSTVEVNYTFYRMPNAKAVEGWDAATPQEFTFVLKAPQRITHFARLKDIDDPLRYFLDTARKLERELLDRKSTRLNSSHSQISYAVFCLK